MSLLHQEREEKKKADEARLKAEADAKAEKDARLAAEQEHIRKMAAKGIIVNHMDDLLVPINNRLEDEDDDGVEASGIENALDALKVAEAESNNQKVCLFICSHPLLVPGSTYCLRDCNCFPRRCIMHSIKKSCLSCRRRCRA
jgi:hypothetical protein